MELTINHTHDFELTGDGSAREWDNAPWHNLQRVGGGKSGYATRFKILWSTKGIYFHFDMEDKVLTSTMTEDHSNLWEEDVIEVFLWPNDTQTLYFEYEISPLDVELVILVPNHEGRFLGWLPWNYKGDRRVRHATSAEGGPRSSGAKVTGWKTDFFFPFALFYGLGNCPPVAGTKWRANMYRIDHDEAPSSQWAWCPKTGGNFHDFRNFGTIVFGG